MTEDHKERTLVLGMEAMVDEMEESGTLYQGWCFITGQVFKWVKGGQDSDPNI